MSLTYREYPTPDERQAYRELSKRHREEHRRRNQREIREANAQLTEEQKAMVPEVDFGFVDDEDTDPMEGMSLEALALMEGHYERQKMMDRGVALW